jgi:DNA-binding XRE family transcriptional regulator
MSDLGELEKLTSAEKLIIHRRRLGLTQGQAAERYGMSYNAYGALERGTVEMEPATVPKINDLKAHEKCFLYRRRAGMSRAKVAEELGRSCQWVTEMERGRVDCTELVCYWEC